MNQAKVRDDCGGALWLVLRELSVCVCAAWRAHAAGGAPFYALASFLSFG